jgi:hypothetical protein
MTTVTSEDSTENLLTPEMMHEDFAAWFMAARWSPEQTPDLKQIYANTLAAHYTEQLHGPANKFLDDEDVYDEDGQPTFAGDVALALRKRLEATGSDMPLWVAVNFAQTCAHKIFKRFALPRNEPWQRDFLYSLDNDSGATLKAKVLAYIESVAPVPGLLIRVDAPSAEKVAGGIDAVLGVHFGVSSGSPTKGAPIQNYAQRAIDAMIHRRRLLNVTELAAALQKARTVSES